MTWPLPPRHMPRAGEPDFNRRADEWKRQLDRWYVTWLIVIGSAIVVVLIASAL